MMWGLGESYIGPFALFLGANNFVMAFIGTGPVLITALAQLTGAILLDRSSGRKPIICLGIAGQAFVLLPLFLLPFLLPIGGMAALIICIALYFLSAGISASPWMSLMGDVVDPAERGRYFANRTRIMMYTMISFMLLAGIITNSWKAVGHTAVGFGFLFCTASLARFASMVFMRHHYDAPLERHPTEAPFSFWDFLRGAKKSNFTKFTFAIALMNGTTNIAGPFFAVYMLRDLQWTYLQFTANMLTFLISQTLFVRWWGGIGDRHGNRSVLVATGCLLPILPLMWVFSTNYLFLLFAQLVSGATWSGFNLAATNFIYDSVPQVRRARALSYYSIINGCFSVIGGMLIGAFVAEHAPSSIKTGLIHITLSSSLPIVFIVSGLARALAAAIMLPQFSEVREIEPISTARILWRLGIGQPLFGQVGEFMPRMRTLLPPKNNKS
ncbi:MAG: MFS transporter [Kiritimatiellales bacterium]|nr:MFS transporter [Kiritimatiellales bacterium]MCF7863292.1 MFS transporter [Kiritimatiellales bacterium]